MTSDGRLWFAKIFLVSICDSKVSEVVLGRSVGGFCLDTHRNSAGSQCVCFSV